MGLIDKEWMDAYHAGVINSIAAKQAILQNQINIKSINGQSILGSGNLDINTISFMYAEVLPSPTILTKGKIFLIPASDSDAAAQNIKDEYITIEYIRYYTTHQGVKYYASNTVQEATGWYPSALHNDGDIFLHENSDFETINWDENGYASGDLVERYIEGTGYDSVPCKLGDCYSLGGHVYMCTENGWEFLESGVHSETAYDWELIGSTRINFSDYYTKAQIDEMLDGATIDIDASNRLVLTKGNNRFFAQLTALAKPESPTISTTTATVVTGNATFTASCATSGATIKYSLDNGSTWSNGPTVTVPSGFSNSSNNATKTQVVKLKAIKNGEESDVASVTVTINPQVAAGSVSITRNGNNNDYSSQATITLTPSASTGAVSSYSQDGGSTWTVFSSSVQLTASSSKNANQYQVKATKSGYADSTIAKSSAFTLNKKKFYYGMGGSSLANEIAIQALTGGGGQEKSTMAGTYSVTAATTGKYLWFCGTGTLTSVTSSGFGVPMEAVAVVDGYNCYRSTSAVQETGTNEFIVA